MYQNIISHFSLFFKTFTQIPEKYLKNHDPFKKQVSHFCVVFYNQLSNKAFIYQTIRTVNTVVKHN